MKLDKLKQINALREIWPNEAKDFTPWLAKEENLSLLGEAIGVEMELTEKESSVGDFNVDILATEQDTGRKIIIENQLEEIAQIIQSVKDNDAAEKAERRASEERIAKLESQIANEFGDILGSLPQKL